jgi:sec-independent protein translocase protein TatA
MPNIGPMELVIVLVIALLVLGPKRLPDAGRSLGRGLREFKDATAPGRDRGEEPPQLSADEPAPKHTNPAPVA